MAWRLDIGLISFVERSESIRLDAGSIYFLIESLVTEECWVGVDFQSLLTSVIGQNMVSTLNVVQSLRSDLQKCSAPIGDY